MGKKNRNRQMGVPAVCEGGSKPPVKANRNSGEGQLSAGERSKAPSCRDYENDGDSSDFTTDSESVSLSLGDEDTLEEHCSIQQEISEGVSVVPETNPEAMDGKGKDATAAKASFASLFAGNRKASNGTKLQRWEMDEGPIQISEADLDAEEEFDWKFCLVGYFAGKFPGKAALHQIVSGWKVKVHVHFHVSSWIIFKFDSEIDQLKVLHEGPYMVYGRPLLLKLMPKFFKFENEDLFKFPVWVQLRSLPLELWTQRALGRICSKIGKPIYADQLTFSKTRVSYARVLVEVDVSKEVVKQVEIAFPDGTMLVQKIFYENLPLFCTICDKVGHATVACKTHAAGNEKEATDNSKERNGAAVPTGSTAAEGVDEGNETTDVENRMVEQRRETIRRRGKETTEIAAVTEGQQIVIQATGTDTSRRKDKSNSVTTARQPSGKQVLVSKEPQADKAVSAVKSVSMMAHQTAAHGEHSGQTSSATAASNVQIAVEGNDLAKSQGNQLKKHPAHIAVANVEQNVGKCIAHEPQQGTKQAAADGFTQTEHKRRHKVKKKGGEQSHNAAGLGGLSSSSNAQ